MIKLEVAGYCHECPSFIADVEEPMITEDFYGNPHVIGDMVIRCANRKKCEMICDYLERVDRK